MKFFYINNSLCTECNRCMSVCPTGAVYRNEEKRYINHDKCISCGSCMKACNDDAVALETIGQMVEKMERSEDYLVTLSRMEKELASVRERLIVVEASCEVMLDNLPVPAFIGERNGRIISANQRFVDISGIDDLRLSEMAPNLAGEYIANIVKKDAALIQKMFTLDNSQTTYVGEIGKLKVSVKITPLSGDMVFCMVHDLRDKNIAADQVIGLLRDSIDRKMDLVQQIGSLLGEATTVEINNINAAINIIETAGGEDGR